MPTFPVLFSVFLLLVWGTTPVASEAEFVALPWWLHEQVLFATGVLAIGLMSIAMVLATRPVWLETPFGGMDRVYRAHKWSAILAGVFAALHWLTEMSDDLIKAAFGRSGRPLDERVGGLLEGLRDVGEELGEFAIYVLLAMLLLSLWKRFPYQFWRHIHRAMPVVYLVLAFHAAVLSPLSYWSNPIGAVMAVLLVAGSVAAFWSLAGWVGRRRRHEGRVESVRRMPGPVTEVVCRLDKAWPGHRAGQFAFVCFDRFEGAHPFTIASADHGDGTVSFEIKALGDYTRRLASTLEAGHSVSVEGPYGRFDLGRCDPQARQVWVAGGVGITPFIAWLESLRLDPASAPAAQLHYCVRDRTHDPFVSQLVTLCAAVPSIKLHVHDGIRDERLSASALAQGAQPGEPLEVWFCGPQGLATSLRAGLTKLAKGRFRFHQEAFELR